MILHALHCQLCCCIQMLRGCCPSGVSIRYFSVDVLNESTHCLARPLRSVCVFFASSSQTFRPGSCLSSWPSWANRLLKSARQHSNSQMVSYLSQLEPYKLHQVHATQHSQMLVQACRPLGQRPSVHPCCHAFICCRQPV